MKLKITYLFAVLGMVLSSCLLPVYGQHVTAHQDIDIVTLQSSTTNTLNRCQCDTVTIQYFLKAGNNFNPGSTFAFQFSDAPNNWVTADTLDLVDLCLDANCNTKATTALDTLRTGTFGNINSHLFANVAIPCNATTGINSLRIINVQSNGLIAPDGISDTMYFNIGQIPTVAEISFARYIDGSVPLENLYTSSDTDMALCPSDTIILRATTDGTQFLWYQNGSPLPGPNGLVMPHSVDSLIVTDGGTYSFEAYNGSCFLSSEDTIVGLVNTPTAFTFDEATSIAFQIDHPTSLAGQPDDSVKFCRDGGFANFIGPDTVGLNGVIFEYEWLTDTIDPNTGDPVFFRADTSFYSGNTDLYDDSIVFKADSRLISFRPDPSGTSRYAARIYLKVYDGYCSDTSEPFMLYMDTVPTTDIENRKYVNGLLGAMELESKVCMKDSLMLRASYPVPYIDLRGDLDTVTPTGNIKYQWQQSRNGLNWANMGAANTDFDDTSRSVQIDTSLSPNIIGNDYIYYYRVVVSVITPLHGDPNRAYDPICTYVSDSVIVRWFPQDSIRVGSQVNAVHVVNNLMNPAINICEGDTAVFAGPTAPGKIENFFGGYQYQWVSDSVDQATGTVVTYALPNDTLRTLKVSPDTIRSRYWLVVSDAFCSDTLGPATVFVDTLPTTDIAEEPFSNQGSTNLMICYYDSLRLGSTIKDPNWSYQWEQYNSTLGSWVPSVADTFPRVTINEGNRPPGEDTTYFRLRTSYVNQFGLERCPYIVDSVRVIFVAPPTVSFFPSDSIGLCEGDSVLVVGQGTGLAYSWENGQGLNASYWITEPGIYPVRVTGLNGCQTYDTVQVYEQTANANAGSDITANSGEIVSLSGTGGTEYRWSASKPLNFNDFLSADIQVSKTLPDTVQSETILIYLEVTNGQGCIGRDTLTLTINNPLDPETFKLQNVYNVMTPNGDGRNDNWDIRQFIQGLNGCELMVLNRWGSVVYEDESFAGTWGGTDNGGNELADGTYYYILSCDGLVQLKSAITIMRNR